MPTAVETFIARALSFQGYTEGPHNNETPFGAWIGHQYQPWCDSFVSWVAADVGLGDVIPPSAYVPGRVAAARRAGWIASTPRRGDLACFDWQHDGVTDHIGIVLGVDGDTLHTLEGNTSPTDAGSQSNGGGVYQRSRRRSQVGAFIRSPYPPGEWTMPITDAEFARFGAILKANNAAAAIEAETRFQVHVGAALETSHQALGEILAGVNALQHGSPVTLDPGQVANLAQAIVAAVAAVGPGVAGAVAAELGRRLTHV